MSARSRFSAGPGVPPAYEAPSRQRRWGELEGWRIIAALGIVAIHVWQQAWGLHGGVHPPAFGLFPYTQSLDLFVDFFFIVSGLVLSYPYLKAVLADPHTSRVDGFKGFLIQRFLRVAPVYFAILLVVWSTRNFGAGTADWLDLIEHVTFLQWLDPGRIFYSIGPAWSIAVEFWMYPLVPTLFFACRPIARRISSRWGRALLAAVLPLAMMAAALTFKFVGKNVWHVPYTDHSYWYSLPAKLDDFGIGILLALVVAAAGDRRFRVWVGWLLRVGGVTGLAFIVGNRYQGSPVRYFQAFDNLEILCHPLAALAFCALVVPALLGKAPDRVTRVIGARPVVVAGGFTYALYLLHEPLLQPLTALGLLGTGSGDMARNWLIVLPISFVLSIGMYLLIEWPMLRIRASFDRRTGKPRDYYAHLRDVHVGRDGPEIRVRVLAAEGAAAGG